MPAEDHESHDVDTDLFEDRLGLAMRQAGGSFETDRSGLVAAGAVRGRRLLLRRRAAVVGGVAAVVLVGAGGTLLVPWGGAGDGRQSVAATSPTPTSTPPAESDGRQSVAATSPTPTPPPPAENDGKTSDAEPPEPPETTPSTPPGADGSSIGQTLTSLLPKNFDVVSYGGQANDYAYVVVDDGKGESLVQINMQPDMSDFEDQLFGPAAEILPDGTKVATSQGPGEKGVAGAVMWTVDTIRPDGRRVVVSAFNSGSQRDDPTRETPALTMQQLREIATSTKWLQLG
ncbi:hypothetical protein [Streptomyces yerevanensis]|uniref:hypothetical protein n=1 Tax=Streptomyces yerevanensis TaxID=66378 RepID=UPI0005261063|nr:hypothetical protein [Streptomyces yerevanensis]